MCLKHSLAARQGTRNCASSQTAEHEWHPEHPLGQSAMSSTVTSGKKFVFSICLDGLLSATSVMSVIWGQSLTGALTEHPVHGWPHLLPPDWLNILRLSGDGKPLAGGQKCGDLQLYPVFKGAVLLPQNIGSGFVLFLVFSLRNSKYKVF